MVNFQRRLNYCRKSNQLAGQAYQRAARIRDLFKTGKLLWKELLPTAGDATPATYEINGRQVVVIAAGGGKSGAPSGGSYVAFALPQ